MVLDALRFFRHMRVMPEYEGNSKKRSMDALDIRDLRDGVPTTIGYARNQELADEFNQAFERIRLILRAAADDVVLCANGSAEHDMAGTAACIHCGYRPPLAPST
jgi:hypothetical protein